MSLIPVLRESIRIVEATKARQAGVEIPIITDAFEIHDLGLVFQCTARGHRFHSAMLVDDVTIIGVAKPYRGRWIPLTFASVMRVEDRIHCETALGTLYQDIVIAALQRQEQKDAKEQEATRS
jgi:hypothetical protein